MIDPAGFQTRSALEDYSVQLLNEMKQFAWHDVLPPKFVNKAQTKKYQYDSSMMRDVETESTSKSVAPLVDYDVFTSNMTTKLHKLRAEVDPRDEAIADKAVADIKFDQATNIMQRISIRAERKMVALTLDSTNYPADLTSTLPAGGTWLDAAGTPEADGVTASNAVMARCFRRPNAVAMAGTTLRKLRTSPEFKERIKYTNSGPVPDSAIMAYLGVEKLTISGAFYNSAAVGAAAVFSEIWDDSVLFYVYEPTPSLRSVGYGHTWMRKDFYSFEYLDNPRGGPDGRITVLEQGLEYEMGAGAVMSSSDGDFVGGYLLKNAV